MERPFVEFKFSLWVFSLALLFLFWAFMIILAPLVEPPNTIYLGDDGKTVIMDHGKEISKMKTNLARITYKIGDFICHQHASRSFFINGNQMPVCSRCTAIFVTFAITLLIYSFMSFRIPEIVYIVLLIPLMVDGGVQLLTPYESTNLIRAITGAMTGFGSAAIFAVVLKDLG